MAADRIVAAAETYMGLPEVGLGILPAGGGTKELVRRVISPAARIRSKGVSKRLVVRHFRAAELISGGLQHFRFAQ